METKLIKVGNSRGVIIPSRILRMVGLEEKINITVEENKIILEPINNITREGWEEAIAAEVAKNGQPDKLFPDDPGDAQNEEWTW